MMPAGLFNIGGFVLLVIWSILVRPRPKEIVETTVFLPVQARKKLSSQLFHYTGQGAADGMSISGSDWKSFTREHWRVGALFGVGVALAIAGSIYVFIWFVANAQSSGLVPATLGLWTMSNLVTFILHAIFWEIVLVGIPVVVALVLLWRWWTGLSIEDRASFRFGGRKRSTGGGGGSLLFFIAFCIKVYLDGKWNVPISSFTLDYVVGSFVLILAVGLIIFAVPATIALVWWLSRGRMRKTLLSQT